MYDEWIVPLKNQLHQMELSIQRLSSQQSPFSPPPTPLTPPLSKSADQVKHLSAQETSTPDHNRSSTSQVEPLAVTETSTYGSSDTDGKVDDTCRRSEVHIAMS